MQSNITFQPTTSFLIKGDISGIQSFIFNVNSKLAAQSLKGRSFFIKILLELGMQMIFDKYTITEGAVQTKAKVSTSGGNFILLLDLPSQNHIDEVQEILNKALQFTGLNMLLAYVPMGQNYGESLKELNQKIRERKYNLLQGKNEFFEPFERSFTSTINDNNKWVKVTDQLKKVTHFSIQKSGAKMTNGVLSIEGNQMKLGGYTIHFGNEGILLNKYLESFFPVPTTFEMLAQDKTIKGIQKLGVLAMDVDNLGVTHEAVKSIEAHRAFDLRLQQFFNDKLRKIIRMPDFQNKIYVVTAGGDDSYFVGKWNVLLELAIEIKKNFLVDVPEPELTISAALVIVDINFPVVRFAAMADDAIKDAKYKHQGHKGNISLFGEVLDWEIMEKEIIQLRNSFNSITNSGLFTSGLLTKARLTSLKIAQGEGIQLSDFWKLGYYMRKFQGNGSKILNQYNSYLTKATTETNPVRKKTYKLIFAVAARLAEFDKRRN
ncbi:MAG: hypothetical protein IPG87_07990 [Saprospiraceae bacterium]|nr:hypothetical protein [Candidatus Vicinibacter affinis]